jgi:ParB-like chromosome segregation protein Spo0J
MLATDAPAAWRNRIVDHADVPPADLLPNPRNWRSHPAEQQRALGGALAEVGWVAEVMVNRTTGNVVDGHLRIELALAREEPSVPVTYVELSEDEERLVLASLDPLAAGDRRAGAARRGAGRSRTCRRRAPGIAG